ncbi:MAG: MarC family protein [Paludibacteraceae bacterium]
MSAFFSLFDIWQILPAFVFLIAIIDPLGNIPVTMNMEKNGIQIKPWIVCSVSMVILLTFLILGEWCLKLFGIKIEYFAIAGGFIIFLMALEMILDVVYFKTDVEGSGNIIPLAFPMYAGPGAFTALIAMTAQYDTINLIVAVVLCMVALFIVLAGTNWLMKFIGKNAIYVLRKFFGIIVLAIACQLMFGNFALVMHNVLTQ